MRANFEKFRPLTDVAVRGFAVGGQNRFSSPGGPQVYCRFLMTYLDLVFIFHNLVCPISPNSYLNQTDLQALCRIQNSESQQIPGVGGKKPDTESRIPLGITELGMERKKFKRSRKTATKMWTKKEVGFNRFNFKLRSPLYLAPCQTGLLRAMRQTASESFEVPCCSSCARARLDF